MINPNSPRDRVIQQKLIPILKLDNPLNINNQYTFLMELMPERRVGEGIYETVAYKSKVDEETLNRKR